MQSPVQNTRREGMAASMTAGKMQISIYGGHCVEKSVDNLLEDINNKIQRRDGQEKRMTAGKGAPQGVWKSASGRREPVIYG